MAKIAIAGHVCADLTPELPLGVGTSPGQLYDAGPLSIRPGGCIANVSRVLSDLGVTPRLSGTVGNDDLGDIVIRELSEAGVRTDDIHRTSAHGTSYSIVIEPAGMNRSFWHYSGANRSFDGSQVNLDDLDLLHVGYPSLVPGLVNSKGAPLTDLMKEARSRGITTSLDLAVIDQQSHMGRLDWEGILERTLPEVDVFSPSVDDLTSALGIGPVSNSKELLSVTEDLLRAGVAVVTMSAGEDGLVIRTAGAQRLAEGGRTLQTLSEAWADVTVRASAEEIGQVDTTMGAGDSVSAAVLYGLAHGMSPQATARLATHVAAQWIQDFPLTADVQSV